MRLNNFVRHDNGSRYKSTSGRIVKSFGEFKPDALADLEDAFEEYCVYLEHMDKEATEEFIEGSKSDKRRPGRSELQSDKRGYPVVPTEVSGDNYEWVQGLVRLYLNRHWGKFRPLKK